MRSFFGRIVVAVWLILFITAALTFLVAGMLPGFSDNSRSYESQLLELLVADFKEYLETAPEAVMARHVLDFDNLLQIYVIRPDGTDIAGRVLPRVVTRLLHDQTAQDGEYRRQRRHISLLTEGMQGYAVVAYQSGFSLGRILVRPGGRLLLLLSTIVVSIAVAWWLSRFIVLPVQRISEAGHKVADGDLSVRVAQTVTGRKDDIAQLARDFDFMTARVAQLLDSQQQLMRDVSHELRSPMARLQALISIARQRETVDLDVIERMEDQLQRLDQLIAEILTFARLQATESVAKAPLDLASLLQTIADDANLEGVLDRKQVEVILEDRCECLANAELLHSALENIVRNALRYSPQGGRVAISASRQAGMLLISVRDQGPGVPDAILGQLFEPFVQLQESDAALHGPGGIGLAIARRAIQLHQGEITARNANGGGLIVDVSLAVSSGK